MLTFDHEAFVIESTASINDLPVFHAQLRDWEDSEVGAVHPVTHRWKALDLGGAFFYQLDLINGWRLKFAGAGPFVVNGNLNGTIVPTGAHIERTTSAAFVTTSQGGSGPSAADIAAAVLATLQLSTIPVNMTQVRGQAINGLGTQTDPWGP